MILENMSMAFHAIKANKMRSFLTMLGIIIGIGSVISIVSIGDSMRAMFADLYKDVGITRALVYVSWYVDDFRQTDYFTLDDVERVKKVFAEDLDYVDSNAFASTDAIYGRKKLKYDFQGIDYNYPDVMEVNIVAGRNLNQSDILGRKNNVVLEEKGAQELFGVDNPVGKSFRATIYGNTSEYTVVGIYRIKQTPIQAMLMGSGDTKAGYIPYTILTWPNDYFQQLNFYAKEGTDMRVLEQKMKDYVAKQKGRPTSEITFYSAQDELGSWDTMMGGLSVAVGGIAAISLLVGGIGIMNIMLVSVTERTREIGIRKALGARTRDVLIQFLTESAILSACGGIIGTMIGVGLVSIGGAALQIRVVIKPSVVLMAVSFSAIVGIFFGIYPASKAAKADPIDALRYE